MVCGAQQPKGSGLAVHICEDCEVGMFSPSLNLSLFLSLYMSELMEICPQYKKMAAN